MDHPQPEPERPPGITRRETLRRIGVVGALTWSAPVLSKVPAFAQTGTPRCTDCAVGGQHCPAGTAQPMCGTDCSCLQTATGDCFCHQFINCADSRVVACTDDTGCPTGWRCARACCADGALRCYPPCGADLATAGVQATAASGMSSGL